MSLKKQCTTFALCLAWLYPTSGHAGFQFSKNSNNPLPTQQSREPLLSGSDYSSSNQPMPIVSKDDVSEEMMPSQGSIIKNTVVSPITPPENEAIDTKGLLNAMKNGNTLSINPYPLEKQAVHASGGTAPVEQAMMEQTGTLRPVATPGKAGNIGLIQRTRYTSKNDTSGNDVVNQTNMAQPIVSKVDSMKLTPIPGGEAPPIKSMIHLEGRVSKAVIIDTAPAAASTPNVTASKSDDLKPVKPEITQIKQANMDSPAKGFTQAVGFGRDLPLALALSQIVPPSYSYAFGTSVDTGAVVSWKGGKTWDKVLDEMLANVGMMAVIKDNQVIIQNKNS